MHGTGKRIRTTASADEEPDLVKSTSCAECRTFKTRCWPDSQTPDGPCLRCQRLDLVCQRMAKKRGRKAPEGKQSRPKKLTHSRRVTLSDPQSADPSTVPIMMQTSFSGGLLTPAGDDKDGDGSTGTPPSETLLPPTGYNQHGSTSIFEGFTSRGNSFAEGLELVSAAADHHRTLLSSFQDPILTGVLGMEDAENLVLFYFENLQDCICLLDPQLHTAVYMRQNSMVLFTAVLAIASKFSQPQLYPRLLQNANDAIRTAILEPIYHIGVVQAICILVYWKQATDDTGWLRIGHACRLGYKLELHIISDSLPRDPVDARKAMDRSRTWLCLYCTDHHHSETHSLPPSIQPEYIPDVDTWLSNNPEFHLPSDGQVAYVIGVLNAKDTHAFVSVSTADLQLVRSMLRTAARTIRMHNRKWTGPDPPIQLAPTSKAIIKFYSQCREIIIEETAMRVADSKDQAVCLGHCVAALLKLLDIVLDDFLKSGYIVFMQDLIVIAIAATALRLVRCLPSVDPSTRSLITQKISQVGTACRTAAGADVSSTAAYLSRFIHRLVRRISDPSFSSRAGSPVLDGRHMHGQPQSIPPESSTASASAIEFDTSVNLGQFRANKKIPNHDDLAFWSQTSPGMMDTLDTICGGGLGMPELPPPLPSLRFDASFAAQYPWPGLFLQENSPGL